ncbi:thioredoxin superfamily protein [Actinidia rufa]|uniref:Thioredoxin superfamily protein n=1 Tax=Actinidia rufa TaxID=165716 RepID=A0A7J0GSB3_9ERIC|nr:thioredoxin superfamily protein [Actinidia rufa]
MIRADLESINPTDAFSSCFSICNLSISNLPPYRPLYITPIISQVPHSKNSTPTSQTSLSLSSFACFHSSAAAMEMVTSLAAQSPVVIFSKSNCCMCHTIKTLICGIGANPTIYELDELPNGQELERELLALGCRPSVPAVFIGREFVGGSNEIMSLHLKGELVKKLNS